MRVEGRKENPHTKRWRVAQELEEVLDSDVDVEAVQDLVRIPTTGRSNRGMNEPSLMESKEMCMSSQGEEDEEEVNETGKTWRGKRKDSKKARIFPAFQVLFDTLLKIPPKKSVCVQHVQMSSRGHLEEDAPTFVEMSIGVDVRESEEEMYMSSGEADEAEVNGKGKRKDKKARIFITFQYFF